jgi:hypothetical protein
MFLTPLSDAMNLLAALRQLGRFLLMPGQAPGQRRGVLALSAQPGCTTSISTRKT